VLALVGPKLAAERLHRAAEKLKEMKG